MAADFNFTFRAPGDPGIARAPAATTNAIALKPFDLFPTRIWQAPLASLAARFDAWVDLVLAMRAASPKPAGRTNRQGWNSGDMAVLDRPDFAPLQQIVRSACVQALAEMNIRDLPFRLQAWINLHDRGGFNFPHVHEGSLLSGSFYLKVPPGSGRFVLRDPRPGVVHGYIKGGVPNGYSDIHLTPETGLLVLFPCWLEHFVEPHNGDDVRIAIAFNAIEDAKAA
jgi:uncharacterized protein (TIGR02466 family)